MAQAVAGHHQVVVAGRRVLPLRHGAIDERRGLYLPGKQLQCLAERLGQPDGLENDATQFREQRCPRVGLVMPLMWTVPNTCGTASVRTLMYLVYVILTDFRLQDLHNTDTLRPKMACRRRPWSRLTSPVYVRVRRHASVY